MVGVIPDKKNSGGISNLSHYSRMLTVSLLTLMMSVRLPCLRATTYCTCGRGCSAETIRQGGITFSRCVSEATVTR